MKVFVVLSMVLATAVGLPNSYGYQAPPPLRTTSPPYVAPPPLRTTLPPYVAPPPLRTTQPPYVAPPPLRTTQPPYVAPPPLRTTQPPYVAPPPLRTTLPPYVAPPPLRTTLAPYVAPAPLRTTLPPYSPPIVRSTLAPYAPPVVRSTEAPAYAPAYGASEGFKATLPSHIPIIRHDHQSDHAGKYQLDVETGHGILHREQGQLRDLNLATGPVGVKSGSYSYPGPNGEKFTVNWTADENGFHATGDHLPTSPPIPEAIKKSLELPRLPEHLLAGPLGEGELPPHPASSENSYAPLSPTLAPVIKVSTY